MATKRKRKTRAERAASRRARLPLVTETSGSTIPADTETTAEPTGALDQLLCDQGHIRSITEIIEKAIYGDTFTEEELAEIRRRPGDVIRTGNNREVIAMERIQLMRAKLVTDLLGTLLPNESPQPLHPVPQQHLTNRPETHFHGDVRVAVDSAGTDVFAIARSLGLQLTVEEESGISGVPGLEQSSEGGRAKRSGAGKEEEAGVGEQDDP